MDTAITVSELLPPADETGTPSDGDIESFEAAVDAIVAGELEKGLATLHGLPDDGPKQFLIRHIESFQNGPPGVWPGTFSLASK